MRMFSLMFALISLVVLAQFVVYLIRGSDPVIAAILFVSFLACLAPALYLLKPFERPPGYRSYRERREQRRSSGNSGDRGP